MRTTMSTRSLILLYAAGVAGLAMWASWSNAGNSSLGEYYAVSSSVTEGGDLVSASAIVPKSMQIGDSREMYLAFVVKDAEQRLKHNPILGLTPIVDGMSIKATAIATGLTAKPETIERQVVKYKNLIYFSWVLSAERMGTHAVVIDVDPDILPLMKNDDIHFQVRGGSKHSVFGDRREPDGIY